MDASDKSVTAASAPKIRGRKKENDKVYFSKAEQKIQEIKNKLKTAKADGMNVKERQRLRNQVSAQQSRIKKKQETIELKNVIKLKDDRIESTIDILERHLIRMDDNVLNDIYNELAVAYGNSNGETPTLQKRKS